MIFDLRIVFYTLYHNFVMRLPSVIVLMCVFMYLCLSFIVFLSYCPNLCNTCDGEI